MPSSLLNLAAPFNVTNAAWLEHFQAHLKADMSSHRGRRRTTTFGESVIAFSSKQGQPVRPKLLFIMKFKAIVYQNNPKKIHSNWRINLFGLQHDYVFEEDEKNEKTRTN